MPVNGIVLAELLKQPQLVRGLAAADAHLGVPDLIAEIGRGLLAGGEVLHAEAAKL